MKRYFIYIAALLSLFTSCEIEVDSNGSLDGFWHLTSIDTLQTGGTRDMSNDKIFWSIQKKILDVHDRQGSYGEIMFRFNHQSDSLLLSSPIVNDRTQGDIPLTRIDSLRPFGINSLNEHFLIETLNGDKMILKSKVLQLNLRKF